MPVPTRLEIRCPVCTARQSFDLGGEGARAWVVCKNTRCKARFQVQVLGVRVVIEKEKGEPS